MSKKKIIFSSICILLICFLLVLVLNRNNDEVIVEDDSILLQVKLDIKEDIGLVIYDYSVGGIERSGGVSNADKSLQKHNSVIQIPMNKQWEFDNLTDIEDLTIKFAIITEYVDPNYDNIYPEEYTKTIETPIHLNAHYGEAYMVTIVGDKENGYQATFEE